MVNGHFKKEKMYKESVILKLYVAYWDSKFAECYFKHYILYRSILYFIVYKLPVEWLPSKWSLERNFQKEIVIF